MERLSYDEDAVLRRLAWFADQGVELQGEAAAVLADLRQRDRRSGVRTPVDVVQYGDAADAPAEASADQDAP